MHEEVLIENLCQSPNHAVDRTSDTEQLRHHPGKPVVIRLCHDLFFVQAHCCRVKNIIIFFNEHHISVDRIHLEKLLSSICL